MKINQILCALVVTLGLTVGPGCGDETDSAPGESPPSGVSPEVGSGNASGDTGGGTDEDPSDPRRPSDPAPGATPAPTPTPTPSPGADSVDVAFSAVPSSGGSVVANPAGAVTAGTQVTFEAIPEQGYRFVSWTGIAASSATATVIVRSDTQAVANFERIPVSLNVTGVQPKVDA
ncbi:MAG: hypothetical protein AAFU77_02390 [Myxococcota bacterium]